MKDEIFKLEKLLLEKKIIFVSGKGGVGKSQVTSLLALQAKKEGLKPLIFECDSPKRAPLLEGALPITSEIQEIVDGIYAVNQNSEEAVVAYAQEALPSKWLAEVLFQNKVTSLFLNASPSVKEMALLGRVVQLSESKEEYSPIIVDLHSTGHALAMLTAPEGIMAVLKSGPIFERAKHIKDVIHNTDFSTILPVTLAEELPVREITEFIDICLEKNFSIDCVILNAVFISQHSEKTLSLLELIKRKEKSERTHAVWDALRFSQSWSHGQVDEKQVLSKILKEKDISLLSLPYLLTKNKRQLANHLFDTVNSTEDKNNAK